MKKIETTEDLVQWASQVNHADTKTLCDLQDVFCRSTEGELKALFLQSAEGDKELLVFAIGKAMGSATLLQFIKVVARAKAERVLMEEGKELEDGFSKLAQDRHDFEQEIRNLRDRNRDFGQQVEDLRAMVKRERETISRQSALIIDLQAQLADAGIEIEKLSAFEAHIKALLTATV